MTNFLLCAISPAMIIFILETVPQNCGSTPVSTVKVGGKNIPTPFMGGIVPNQNVNPISKDSGVLKNWEYGVLGSFIISRLLGLEVPTLYFVLTPHV